MRISGYAGLYNYPYSDGVFFNSKAFAEDVSEFTYKRPMLFNHDENRPIGHWSFLRSDGKGLFCEGVLFDEDVIRMVMNFAVSGLSMGYSIEKSESSPEYEKGVIQKATIEEISLVTMPLGRDCRLRFTE